MCYSAKVTQSLEAYLRVAGASPDWPQIEQIFRQRLADPTISIPRGFERNFDHSHSHGQRRIRELLDQYRAGATARLEQEVFAQKKRLADAHRKLKENETRSGRNEAQIVTIKIETALAKLSLLKGTQWHEADDRIFPMSYGPIVVAIDGQRRVRLARYQVRQSVTPASVDRHFPEPCHSHALLLVSSFFENVDHAGSNVLLRFTPKPPLLMWVACLCDERIDPGNGSRLLCFTTLTGDPPEEVRAAGQDRMIINIRPERADEWLTPANRPSHDLLALLNDCQTPYYEHRIEAA